MDHIRKNKNKLVFKREKLEIWIAPYGKDVLRVRQRIIRYMPDRPFALASAPELNEDIQIRIEENCGTISNGRLSATIDASGNLSFFIDDTGIDPVLSEIHKDFAMESSDLARICLDFKAYDEERFYGLGQHPHGFLDQKGCIIDFKQINTKIAIPVLISSRKYGVFWNDPATGRVELGNNRTRWVADASRGIDYFVFSGASFGDLMKQYARITGFPPMLPEWAAGFWQSKLRYRNQDELLSVAREYKKRGLPLSVIVIDFFHWTMLGDFKFDPKYWPDPKKMVEELRSMGIEVAVSVWPMVNRNSENYEEMLTRGLLLSTERGVPVHHEFIDTFPKGRLYSRYYDATNPETMTFVWDAIRRNYHGYGIRVFWLDNCEPDIRPRDFDNLRFHLGNGEEIACIYPLLNQKGFYDGLHSENEKEIVLLCRSGWAGSQRYGSLIWSGDIPSSFESLRCQVRAGLNMAMSGIPWWTTDIGGFHGGDPTDPEFQELIIRWFQYGVFCPIFRLHGVREPSNWRSVPELTGAGNEVWSFGETAYRILMELLHMRQRLIPYILMQMDIAHRTGIPPMRPVFFDFETDSEAFNWEDEFLFGPDILVAPVTSPGADSRDVYLPSGTYWTDVWSGRRIDGGTIIKADAPLERIPLYERGDPHLPILK